MSVVNKTRKSNFLTRALWQVIPVMLGVFLGLWANNLNEDRKQNKLQTKVLEKIRQDIQSNKIQLENVINYHRSLGDSVQNAFEHGENDLFEKTRFELGQNNPYDYWRGTRTGTLRDGGYQTAINTGLLVDMDFELVSLLSEINQDQNHYVSMSNMYLSTAINMRTDIKIIDHLIFMSSFSTDMTLTEERLISIYEEALKQLGE